MSSTNVDSEQKDGNKPPPLSIQQIIQRLNELHEDLSKADSAQQSTTNDNQTDTHQQHGDSAQQSTTNDNQTGTQQHGSTTPDASTSSQDQENKNETSNNDYEGNKRKEVLHEVGKLCIELKYMIRSFEKLEKFENKLRDPLETLKANVHDILHDLPQVQKDQLPKQVPINLRVLRDNITKVKILIPSQHQTANTNSEANRSLQTTVATTEAQDLPHLYNEGVFEDSYYFKEIEEKYNELEDREKLCLFCFVIFPENAEIKKRLLRFWWVGEDLFRDRDPEDEKELVSKHLKILVGKGLIEPVKKKNKLEPRSYKMNPIVRSSLIKFAKKEHFFDYDSEGKPTMNFSKCKKACMVKSEIASDSWFSKYLKAEPGTNAKRKKGKEEPRTSTQEERLSADLVKLQMLFNFPDRATLIEASEKFTELQTLFNVSKQFPALPKEWISKMKALKVLYLGRWESAAGKQRHIEVEDIDFLRGLKSLKKLRLLSLQGVSGIPKLPRAVCQLENLRMLDLRACHSLEKLPDRIGSLKELTYMDLSECYLLDDMPKELSKLVKLQVLKGFVIGDSKDSCTLSDLSALKNLRKLSVDVSTKEFDIDHAGDHLSLFEKLEKLKIAWGAGWLAVNDLMEDAGSKRQTGQSNPTDAHGGNKKRAKEQANSKAMNQLQVNGKATESSNEKENKEEDKGNQEIRRLKSFRKAINLVLILLKAVPREQTKKDRRGLEKLVKLDLQCFPRSEPPSWLVPKKMIGLTKLCVRGGKMSYLLQEGDEKAQKWKVKTLRLKYLLDFKMDWMEMTEKFPDLEYLENVRCPRITFCPCDANGVWQKSFNLS